MMNVKMLCASLAIAVAGATPSYAQMQHGSMGRAPMASTPAMAMPSAGDANTMMSCKKMARTAMMKNRRCSAMMKKHPQMMKMSPQGMQSMMSCMKMPHAAMMKSGRCSTMMKMHPGMMGAH